MSPCHCHPSVAPSYHCLGHSPAARPVSVSIDLDLVGVRRVRVVVYLVVLAAAGRRSRTVGQSESESPQSPVLSESLPRSCSARLIAYCHIIVNNVYLEFGLRRTQHIQIFRIKQWFKVDKLILMVKIFPK